MKPRFSRSGLLASIVFTLALATGASHAASGNWTLLTSGNASGSWATATNWSSNPTIPGSAADDVIDFSQLNITATSTVTMDGSRTAGTLNFGDATTSSNGWALNTGTPTGTTLTLAATANPVINVVNQTATLGVALAGTSGFTKTGAGTLVFISTGNTYGGITTVSAGTLQVGGVVSGTGVQGKVGSGSTEIAVASGATLSAFYGPAITQVISGAGNVSSITNFGVGGVTATLSGLNTYTGTTTISVGNLNFNTIANGGQPSSIGASASTAANFVISGGATVAYTGTAVASTDRLFNLTGTGVISNNAAAGNSLTFSNTGAITFGTTNAARSFSLGGSNTDNNVFTPAIGNNGTGVVTLTKIGAGTWTLAGASTYTGATTVSAGTLKVTGSLASPVTVASAASLAGQGGSTSSTLSLSAGSVIYGVPSTAGAGTAFRAGGAVTAGSTVTILGSDGTTTVGSHTIDVLGYGTTPGTANFSVANYHSATVADDTTNKKITLTYTSASRTWNSASSTWDAMTTLAWQEGDFEFGQSDAVTFDDTGTGGGAARTVTLNSTVTPGSVTFGNSTSAYTVSGTGSINGGTSVIKNGSGTTALSTANGYAGGTLINGGRLQGGSVASFGTGAVSVASGAQAYLSAAGTYPNVFTISGTGYLDSGIGNLGAIRLGGATVSKNITMAADSRITAYSSSGTLSGVIGESGGSRSLELGGTLLNSTTAGTINISGANTYTGATAITNAIVNISTNTAFGTGAVTLTGPTAAGRIVLANGLNISNALTCGTNVGTSGLGVLEITATNAAATWSGPISITAGVSAGGHLYTDATSTLTLSGVLTATSGFTQRAGNVIYAGGGTASTVGVTGLAKVGVTNGIPSNAALSLGVSAAATLDINGFNQTLANLTHTANTVTVVNNGASAATLTINYTGGTASTYDTVIANGTSTLNFAKDGSGTYILTGANTYTGTTTISGGVLQVGAAGTTGNLGTGAVINNGTLAFNRITTATTVANAISGSGGLTQAGTNMVTLTGANTYTGGTTITGGTLSLGSAGAVGTTGTVFLNGGGLQFTAANTTDLTVANRLQLGGSVANIDTNGQNVTFSTAIVSDLFGGLNKVGSGALTLQGNNTFDGGIQVTAGTLKLDYTTDDNSKIEDSCPLALAGGTLQLTGGTHQEVVGNTSLIAGDSTITRATGAATIALGSINHTGATATLNITAPSIATTTLANDVNGRLPAWITVNGQAAAADVNGYIVAFAAFTDVTRLGGILPNTPTDIRIIDGGTSGPITPATTGSPTTVSTVTQSATAGPATIAMGADTLRLGATGSLTVPTGAGALTITGGALTAGGDDFTPGDITVDTIPTTTLNLPVTDNGSSMVTLTKKNTGALVLSGANTYTGVTTISAGTLQIGGASNLNAGTYSGAIGNAGTFEYSSSANQTLSGIISGTGVLTKDTDATSILTLTGVNTYTGGTTISAGTLQIGGAGNLNAGSYSGAIANAGTFNYSSSATQTLSGIISGAGAITKSGSSTLTLAGANTYTGLTTISAGTLAANSAGALGSSPAISIASGATFSVGSGVTLSNTNAVTMVASGNANPGGRSFLNLGATGAQISNAINLDYSGLTGTTGGTHVTAGGTTAATASVLASNVVFAAGKANATGSFNVLFLRGASTFGKATGSIDLLTGNSSNAATLGLADSGTSWELSGAHNHWTSLAFNTTTTGQNLYVGAANTLAAEGVLTNTSTATGTVNLRNLANTTGYNQTVAGIKDGTGKVNVTSTQAATLTIGGSGTYSTSGVISGSVALTMNGTGGTQALAGTNTYTGATTVSAGNLAVNNTTGSGTGTSVVTVSAAGTLSGTGTLSGAVTDSGTLAPGSAGVGTLSTGALTLSGSYACDVSGVTADKVAVTGNLNVTGATLAITATGSQTGTLVIASYTGTLTGTFATVTGLPAGCSVNYNTTAKQIELVAAAGYSTWAATNAGGQAANLDFDHDGVPNGVEYFMGQTGSSFTPNPAVINGVITWPKDPTAVATYVVQTSPDLVTWSPAAGVVDNGTSVSFTLPTGAGKLFVRIKVTTP